METIENVKQSSKNVVIFASVVFWGYFLTIGFMGAYEKGSSGTDLVFYLIPLPFLFLGYSTILGAYMRNLFSGDRKATFVSTFSLLFFMVKEKVYLDEGHGIFVLDTTKSGRFANTMLLGGFITVPICIFILSTIFGVGAK